MHLLLPNHDTPHRCHEAGGHTADHPPSAVDPTPDPTRRMVSSVMFLAVGVSLLIATIKWVAWWFTDSVAIFASALDALMDAGVSGFNGIVAYLAMKPPDHEHRFGHGKAEDMGVLLQSSILCASGGWVLVVSLQRWSTPMVVDTHGIGMALIFVSLLLTGILVLAQRRVIASTHSAIVKADHLHYLSDLCSNAAVLLLLAAMRWWNIVWLDSLVGGMIGGYMVITAAHLAYEAFQRLMDHEFSESERQEVLTIIAGCPGVRGMHDVRTRMSGSQRFIQCHLELDGSISLFEAHALGDTVERRLLERFPKADILIHHDPR